MGRLAVLVIACVLNQDSVFGQCKTGHCSGDDGDGGTLATTVSQLQESVEALQQQVTLQEVKLTAQEKSIAFLRNASMSLLYHLVGANVTLTIHDVLHAVLFLFVWNCHCVIEAKHVCVQNNKILFCY